MSKDDMEIHCEHTTLVDPGDLKSHPKNANRHPEKQIEALAGNIRQFGWRHPVVVSKLSDRIVMGHGRRDAALLLGCKAPVDYQEFATEDEELAVLVADNVIPELAEMDDEILRANRELIEAAGFDLEIIGFEVGEEEPEQIDVDAEPQIDRAAELLEKWKVQPGQLWQLGDHRLLCGDSTKADDVGRVMGRDEPLLMVTDPPYGVEYNADWRNNAFRADGSPVGAQAVGKVKNDERANWADAWGLFSGDVAYVWHADLHADQVKSDLESKDLIIRQQVIWAKNHMVIGRSAYHFKHEPCWYAVRKGKKANWIGGRKQTTLWEIDKPHKSETGHSTQKPVECMATPIKNHDSEFVYEPFSGSGTTIIACEQLGRKCRAIEIDPAYCAVTLERYMEATGTRPHQI
jgi:DNA modification methylase